MVVQKYKSKKKNIFDKRNIVGAEEEENQTDSEIGVDEYEERVADEEAEWEQYEMMNEYEIAVLGTASELSSE